MANSNVEENSSGEESPTVTVNQRPSKGRGLRKRKLEECEDKRTKETAARHKQRLEQKPVLALEKCSTDDNNDDARTDISNGSVTKKKKQLTTTTPFMKLVEIEDNAPLCVLGETEANMFPRKLKFMNQTIDVMFDSRVHIWLKADDFAKALGYKNHKSAVERYVNPLFVRNFPDVLDMSRARYGDAYRLFPLTSKVLFINEAGVLQLLLRSMISNEYTVKETTTRTQQSTSEQTADDTHQEAAMSSKSKHHSKPKLSADWINYQILPSLVTFSDAAKTGITAMEQRRLHSMNHFYNP